MLYYYKCECGKEIKVDLPSGSAGVSTTCKCGKTAKRVWSCNFVPCKGMMSYVKRK